MLASMTTPPTSIESDVLASTTTRTVTRGPVTLHVTEVGDRDGPTVLLVHGYPDTSTVWDRVRPRLAPTCHVVTVDVRGAGRSTRPARVRDHALPELTADLVAVADAVAPDRPVHLVGHDWGAIQGWEAVADEATAPRLASFTAISAPSFDLTGHWVRRQLSRRRIAPLLGQARRSWYIAAFQVPGLAPAVWRAGLGRRWADVRRRVEGAPDLPDPAATITDDGVHGIRLYRANAGRVRAPRRDRVLVPTRVLVGEHDAFVSPALFAGLEGVTVDVVPSGRHWLPLTHPEAVAAAVEAHVDDVQR